jgi:hypothetical protein
MLLLNIESAPRQSFLFVATIIFVGRRQVKSPFRPMISRAGAAMLRFGTPFWSSFPEVRL